MSEDTLWFIIYGSQLALRRERDGTGSPPRGAAPPLKPAGMVHQLGLYENAPCAAYAVVHAPDEKDWLTTDLRKGYAVLDPGLHPFANKAFELVHWDRQSQYCPCCGIPTQPATPISKSCPTCGREIFPTLTPAVLALVRKGDSILLAHAHAFRGPFHSILAGYLEPGESLEDCVRREVLEETGITVGNIAYFGSQAWPFPSNLMVGFIADYKSGELKLQEDELESGAFYTRDSLPELPGPFSLSRRMIDWWISQGG